MTDFLTFLQIACLLLLASVGSVYAVLRLRWRAEAAERELRNERLRRSRLDLELAEMQESLIDAQRSQLGVAAEQVGPLDHPPDGVDAVLEFGREHLPPDPYLYVLGWERTAAGPSVVGASLHGDSSWRTHHGLITGRSDHGKDLLAFLIAWFLCARATPDQLQIVWIDGTMSDGALLRGLAHNWAEPILGPEGVPQIMRALRLERERRDQLRVVYGVSKWEELPDAVRPPLIWIYVSELDVLELGCANDKELENWLVIELTSARKAGIRYWIGAQTVANRRTRWRDQISCYCVGYQDTERAIQPNAGMSSAELEELGGWSPLRFTGPGYFTIRIGRQVATIRTPKIDLHERQRAIAQLPKAKTRGHTVLTIEPVQELVPRSLDWSKTAVPAIQQTAPRSLGTASECAGMAYELDPALVAHWEPQIRTWAAIPLSRWKMAKQMQGVRHATAYKIIAIVLGPARQEHAQPMIETTHE